MIEFVDNNTIFSMIELFLFFVNKNFHFCMSFSFDFISFIITKKRLLIVKTENLTSIMQNILNFVRDHATDNEEFDDVNDVKNNFHDFYQKNFVVAKSESFKLMIVVFFVVDEQDFSTNRRRSRKKIAVLTFIEITFN